MRIREVGRTALSIAAATTAAGLLALAGLMLCAAPGQAAAKLVTLDAPSKSIDPATQNFQVDPITPSMGVHPGTLKVNVLLPDGYTPTKRYPMLLLYHGAGERYDSWIDKDLGDIRNTAAGLNAVIVMPEGAHGFYTNWWNGGQRGNPSWEDYITNELLPLVESKFSIRPERRYHAVAGFSMGGYGTWLTGARMAGFFGTVVPLSAFASIRDPLVTAVFPIASGGTPFDSIYGPNTGFYAAAHDPINFGGNLRYSNLDVYTGNGLPDTGKRPQNGTPTDSTSLLLEGVLKTQNDEAVAAMRAAGNDNVDYTIHAGSHNWEFWRPDLKAAIAKGLFQPVEEHPADWDFVAPSLTGKAWDIAYRFTVPNTQVVTFSRRGNVLSATGDGTVEISDGNGCRFTRTVPFSKTLASSPCRKLKAGVKGSLKGGKAKKVRVTVTGPDDFGAKGQVDSARVWIGKSSATTSFNGVAMLKVRAKKGTRKVKLVVTKAGYGKVTKVLKVRP